MGISIGTVIDVITKAGPLIQQGAQVLDAATHAATAIRQLGEEAKTAFAGHPDVEKLEAALATFQATNDQAFAANAEKLRQAADRG